MFLRACNCNRRLSAISVHLICACCCLMVRLVISTGLLLLHVCLCFPRHAHAQAHPIPSHHLAHIAAPLHARHTDDQPPLFLCPPATRCSLPTRASTSLLTRRRRQALKHPLR